MIKLNNILTEEDNFRDITTKLTKDLALSILHKYYTDDEIKNCRFMKGIYASYNDYIHVNTRSLVRTSRNTYNIYNLLFSEILPSWKKYPKRNKSIVGSSSFIKASRYGDAQYKVFPIEPTYKIGVCSAEDLWESFPSINISLNDVNYILSRILISLDLIQYSSDINVDIIKDTFSKITPDTALKMDDAHLNKYFIDFINSNEHSNLLEYLNDKLSPDNNNFNLIDNINKLKSYDNNEIWTSANSILIRTSENY